MKRSIAAAAFVMLCCLTAVAAEKIAARPGWLGFGFVSPSNRCANQPVRALIVRRVAPGGPAEEAGLVAGDVIVAMQGKKIEFRSDAEALEALSHVHAGERLVLDVVRGQRKDTITIRAAEMDDDQLALWNRNFEMARQRDAKRK